MSCDRLGPHRITTLTGALLSPSEELTHDEAHELADDLEERRVSYRWQSYAGSRVGWVSVRGAVFGEPEAVAS